MAEKLIFTSLRRELKGKDELMIVGGTISEAKVINWLREFKGMPWRVWEWVNDFRLEHESLTPAFPLAIRLSALERVRLFGDGGDLTVRRDGALFRWHFIGPSGAKKEAIIPAGWQSCHDYWDRKENESQKLTCSEQKALLWGAYNQELGRWYDNRVGFAHLEYPLADVESLLQEDKKGHVYAYYREYLDGGQVAFVWMYKLDSLNGVGEVSGHHEAMEQKVSPSQDEEILLSESKSTSAKEEKEKESFWKRLWRR